MNQESADKKYWAFISYSSKDRKWGQWLHKRLENYPIPEEFRGVELFDGATLGKNLRPVFRDRDELSGSADLGPAIHSALQQSRFLVVLCSPNSAQSQWVNKEIVDFKELHGEANILALILEGEPNATSNDALANTLECFPPALQYPAEPLAGDLRKEGDGKERGFLKVLSGIAQLDFDVLYRRHERAQRRKRTIAGVLALAIILALSGLTSFAFTQKREAETQRSEAQHQRQEAQTQRDSANRNLANVYFEKAERASTSFEGGRGPALAWLQEAVDANPEILQRSDVQNRANEWRGPWPAPNKLTATGRMVKSLELGHSLDSLVSAPTDRVWVQSTKRAWSLLDLTDGTTITTGLFPEDISEAESHPEASLILLRGRRHLVVLDWKSGDKLGSLDIAYPEIIQDAKRVGDRILIATYHYNEETSALSSWNWTEEPPATPLKKDLPGTLEPLVVSEGEHAFTILSLLEKDAERSLALFSMEKDGGSLKQLDPLESNEGDLAWIDDDPTEFANGLCRLFRKEESTRPNIFDAHSGSLYRLEIEDKQFLQGVLYQNSQPTAIVGTWNDRGNRFTVSSNNLSSKTTPTPLFDGKLVDKLQIDPSKGKLVALDEESRQLGLCSYGGACTWTDLALPSGSQFICFEIQFIDSTHLALSGYTWPGEIHIAILLELDEQSVKRSAIVATHGFEQCLSMSGTGSSIESARILSHRGSAISSYEQITPLTELIERSGQKEWSIPGQPLWVSVDESGSPAALCYRTVSEKTSIGYSIGGAKPAKWHDVESLGNDPASSIKQETSAFLLLSTWEASLLFQKSTGAGIALPENTPPETILLCETDQDPAVLFQTENSLRLARLPSLEPLWTVELTSQLHDIRINDETQSVLLLSSRKNDFGEPLSYSLILSTLSLNDGSTASTSTWNADSKEAKAISDSYNTMLRLVATNPPATVLRTPGGDDLYRHRLFGPDDAALQLQKEWLNDDYQLTHHALGRGAFVMNRSIPDEQKFELGSFYANEDTWNVLPLTLDGPLDSLSASPDSSRLVVLTNNHRSLWDPVTGRQLNGQLSVLAGRNQSANKLGTGFRTHWHPVTGDFYLWNERSVHWFQSETGAYNGTLSLHTRKDANTTRDQGICAVGTSPDGQWIVTADTSGRLLRSKLSSTSLDADELRWATQALGGYRISESQELQRWVPGVEQ